MGEAKKLAADSGHEKEFAAVLGDPVGHSRTPIEQQSYFAAKGLSVFAVRLTEEEWNQNAIPILTELGLRFAAVTAPLKRLAYEVVKNSGSHIDEISGRLKSMNTLTFNAGGVTAGTNTDLSGLKEAVRVYAKDFAPPKSTAVWGGGGTLDVIRELFPQSQFFSARTGLPRDGSDAKLPDLVVWAGGLGAGRESVPPSNWTPKIIFDLNYSDSSLAREYALRKKARYISGLAMFRAQAQAQRIFWDMKK